MNQCLTSHRALLSAPSQMIKANCKHKEMLICKEMTSLHLLHQFRGHRSATQLELSERFPDIMAQANSGARSSPAEPPRSL